jgi:hypothetical protein
MNRKSFLQNVAVSSGLAAIPMLTFARDIKPVKYAMADPLPAEKVKDFVGAGHNNLDKVKQLLEEFPTLIYATWDLGGGDFETGLEGAGHVGNKDIANFLIEKGARTNLFVLTMLGKTAIVKAYIETYPSYLYARGPHGFTLLHHANRGGEEAKELVDYLKSKGLNETRAAL